METELTKFIGLACYKARLKKHFALPESVLKDMLLVTVSDGVDIEPLETWFRRPHMRIACPYVLPVDLQKITSRFFTVQQDPASGRCSFETTDEFERALPKLSLEETILRYEPYINALLEIALLDERSEILKFVSLVQNNRRFRDCLPYGGLRALIDDVEFIVATINGVIRESLYLNRDTASLRQQAYQQITQASLDFDDKLRTLKAAAKHMNQLRATWKGWGLGQRLLERTRHFEDDCVFFEIIRTIKECLLRIAQPFTSQPFSNADVSALLREELRQVDLRESQPSSIVEDAVELWETLKQRIELWNRAFLAKTDPVHFGRHKRTAEGFVPGGFVSSFDIRGSTKRLKTISVNRNDPTHSDVEAWYLTSRAIPRNWTILFAGQVENVAGDTEIGVFRHSREAIRSAVLALMHARLLNQVIEEPTTFSFALKAGVGLGDISEGHQIFHMIMDLTDMKKLEKSPDMSIAVALKNFAEDNDLAKYEIRTFESTHGPAIELDHHAMGAELTAHLLGRWAGSASS